MGTRELTLIRALVGDLPDDAAAQVFTYLPTLDDALKVVSQAERVRFLTESADALAGEIDAGTAAGKSPGAAASAAVEGFGAPDVLAAQLAAAIAPGTARRTGLALIVTGPLVGLTWITAIGHGHDWTARLSSVLAMAPYVTPLLAATVACAMAAVLGGWLPAGSAERARLATGAARAAALGCVVADAVLLFVGVQQHLGFSPGGGGGGGGGGWLIGALVLSALRLMGAASAGYRLSRLRAAGC